jgi:polyisoprenoid-binding protein YceI
MLLIKLFITPLLIGLSMLFTIQETPADVGEAFQVDAVHSTAIFRVHHLGAGMFYGRFNDISGTITGDENPAFDISIDINSVDTNNEKLDSHLKSPDFFNAVEFSEMTFKSSATKKVGDDKYEVTGDITIHGVTKPLTVTMTKTGQVTGRRGESIGFEMEFQISRSDYGMNYGIESGALSNDIKVIVALEAGRK